MAEHRYVDGGILLNAETPKADSVETPAPAIVMPETKVSGDAVRKAAREIIKLWQFIEPEEYAAYAKECDDLRKTRARKYAMSEGGELSMPYVLPAYVALMMGRFLQDYNWWQHDEAAVQAVLSEIPCSRIGMDWRSSALCDADRR